MHFKFGDGNKSNVGSNIITRKIEDNLDISIEFGYLFWENQEIIHLHRTRYQNAKR